MADPSDAFPPCDIGLIGLAVMGQNLALNMADHGYRVAVYNRTTAVTDKFIADSRAHFGQAGGGLVPAREMSQLAALLKRPRKILLMVKAGSATDAVINRLAPLLEPDDIIIDGGNAHWEDTIRREKSLKQSGLRLIGSGVSGGEEGARFGPSLMVGGEFQAWQQIEPIWKGIAAKVDPASGRPYTGAAPGKPINIPGAEPCAAYIGPDGAGHYVKMVHNGIEYGDMQMICEAYHLMRDIAGLSATQMAAIFAEWNSGELDSFLIQITADILQQKDPVTGRPFVDVVLDAAGQKGTGKWTSTSALDLGVPAATIAEAVFARAMSALKEERIAAARILRGPESRALPDQSQFVESVRRALYCSKICSYAQGFQLLGAAGQHYNWEFDYGTIAMIWRGGCIIRARFLQKIKEAYEHRPELRNLLLGSFFAGVIQEYQQDWRDICAAAARAGIPLPAFFSALAYYDACRAEHLPHNLLQAQRDYFGAHLYERIDQPRGRLFHLDWIDPDRPQQET
jgi:6-phosphogluconate dehydrogenase